MNSSRRSLTSSSAHDSIGDGTKAYVDFYVAKSRLYNHHNDHNNGNKLLYIVCWLTGCLAIILSGMMVANLTTMVEDDGEQSVGLPMDESTKGSSEKVKEQTPLHTELDFSRSTSPSSKTSVENDVKSQENLEERVQELEAKLATLSLMLSQQRAGRRVSPPLHVTPPASPPPPEISAAEGVLPALDSPAPLRPSPISDRKRNLSFQILHGDSSPPENRMGLGRSSFKNVFLPTSFPAYKPTRLMESIPSIVNEEEPKEIPDTTTSTSDEDKKDIKSKWLDYLNSFQQSNYDVDMQMEEFVKIPSAVEALLGFGFWICVDSFLYVLTVLPIRFVWSLLLGIRYVFFWTWKGEVPEGPFRFHRRCVSRSNNKTQTTSCFLFSPSNFFFFLTHLPSLTDILTNSFKSVSFIQYTDFCCCLSVLENYITGFEDRLW